MPSWNSQGALATSTATGATASRCRTPVPSKEGDQSVDPLDRRTALHLHLCQRWQDELYVKTGSTIDYRIHSTGTSVVVNVLPDAGRIHGTIFFPRWVHEHPDRTVLFQNDHLELMERYRAAAPTYPIQVVTELPDITRIDDLGEGDDGAINAAPSELPPGYLDPR